MWFMKFAIISNSKKTRLRCLEDVNSVMNRFLVM